MGISKTSRTTEGTQAVWLELDHREFYKKYQIIVHEAKFQGKDVNLPALTYISITTEIKKLTLRQHPFNTFLLFSNLSSRVLL